MKARGVYMISVVSEMLDLHPQTIRQYERMGLLKPARTDGNKRRYSDDDVERLRYVLKLTREMGINIAGVEMIIGMQEHILRLEQQLEELTNH
ncbi:MAG: MerR family transcriptional regulator [Deferribacteraceae bacterium]|jgi:MerR family transcriptional regulator/heat shock protein HspR|nr:MerR family transcriptional regulator [Deferribacteraceae bacterium]